MADGVTLFIGPRSLASSLAEHPDTRDTELLVFDEDAVCQAVEHMMRQPPRVVALPEKLALSPRGTALAHRIAVDAQLAGTQVLMIDGAGAAVTIPADAKSTWLPLDGPAPGGCLASPCVLGSTSRLTVPRRRSSICPPWARRSCRRPC